jgi:hypothetical protein
VGFVTTTSASFTRATLRFFNIARARERMRPLVFGSPSDCLVSSSISLRDMRSSLRSANQLCP